MVVSLAAVFWMSRNVPPKQRTLRDIQKTAARKTTLLVQMVQSIWLANERTAVNRKVDLTYNINFNWLLEWEPINLKFVFN